MACPAINDATFLSSVLAHVDCQAATLGESGYMALSTPGGIGIVLLGTALTVFIALIGYRLLLGERLELRDGVLAAIKVGVVLMLATSWPAFRTLAYDVALRGPTELASAVGAPAGLPGGDGSLVQRLQIVDDELAELALIGSGRPPDVPVQVAGGSDAPDQLRQLAQRRPWDPARDFSLLGNARVLFLVATIAAFAATRLLAGLLLALGPLFALFLLFERTRGIFEGWVRGLAGAALAALAAGIVLGVELALVEPWLAEVLSFRRADIATPAVPVELVATMLVFAVALVAVLVGAAKVAHGFRMPDLHHATSNVERDVNASIAAAARREVADPAVAALAGRSRAAAITDVVAGSVRRETGGGGIATGVFGADGRRPQVAPHAASSATDGRATLPLGRSFQRRTRARVSALAGQRDRSA